MAQGLNFSSIYCGSAPPVVVDASSPVPIKNDAADAAAAAVVLSLGNPYTNPSTIQWRITERIPIKLVTEYLKVPFIISEIKPESSVTSGENAPANAPTILRVDESDEPENPERIVAAKSGNVVNVSDNTRTTNDNTLNVSAAAARFCVVSTIVFTREDSFLIFWDM
jgi:hypothetical protein